jgi:hypothetical protein
MVFIEDIMAFSSPGLSLFCACGISLVLIHCVTAERIGISRNNTVEFRSDSESIHAMYDCVCEKVSCARSSGTFNIDKEYR